GAGGEIQLTDAMLRLAAKQPFYGLKFEGRSFDCGSKIGFLTANVAYGLARPELATDLREAIRGIIEPTPADLERRKKTNGIPWSHHASQSREVDVTGVET